MFISLHKIALLIMDYQEIMSIVKSYMRGIELFPFVRYDRRTMKGECPMGKSIYKKDDQLSYLKERLAMFLEVLENIDPETTELDDIDRLITIIDELETKIEQFKKRSE